MNHGGTEPGSPRCVVVQHRGGSSSASSSYTARAEVELAGQGVVVAGGFWVEIWVGGEKDDI